MKIRHQVVATWYGGFLGLTGMSRTHTLPVFPTTVTGSGHFSDSQEIRQSSTHNRLETTMRFKIKLTTILPKLTIHPTILIVGAMVAANGSTYGQGTVDFNTFVLGTGALVYDAAAFGGEPLGSAYVGDGTNFFAQLYAAARTGAATSSLVAVGVPVNFRGGVSGGWVQTSGTTSLGFALTPSPPGPGTVVTIPFLTLGGPATVQMRAWWGGGNVITSYEDAVVSSNPNSRWGASLPIDLAATGSPGGLTPVSLTGLQGFELIPEPSTLVLAGMGAAALLFFRRRK